MAQNFYDIEVRGPALFQRHFFNDSIYMRKKLFLKKNESFI